MEAGRLPASDVMTCADLDDLIEPLAAGDIVATPEMRAHLDACAACTDALARASAIDRLLLMQPAPEPSPEFVTATIARMRRERWRMEQRVDLVFNISVGIVALLAVLGLYAVLVVTGVGAVGADLVQIFTRAVVQTMPRVAQQAPLYAVSTLVLLSGLGIWWWAENGVRLE